MVVDSRIEATYFAFPVEAISLVYEINVNICQ